MRLDKYLQVARILKRRSVAKELADQSRITLNGRTAKPSSEIAINDEIQISFGNRELRVKVLMIQKQVSKNDATLLYEIIEEIRKEEVIPQ